MRKYIIAVMSMFVCVWIVNTCTGCCENQSHQHNRRQEKEKQKNVYLVTDAGELILKWSNIELDNIDGVYLRFRTKDNILVRCTAPYVIIEE
jgi:hypothetical protein